jgi:beta-lactamase regulating signal transducer with metallopeptidase domain
MVTAETLIRLYLDLHILLALGALAALLADLALRRMGLRRRFDQRLALWRWGLAAVLLSPVLIGAFRTLGAGMAETLGARVNFSDFLVAQYLQCNVRIDPFTFETLLGAPRALVDAALAPTSLIGTALVALVVIGTAFGYARLAIAGVALRRVIADTHPWRRVGRVEVRLSDTVSVPFSTRSLRRRFVVLPTAMLGRGDDLRMAVAHEFQHLRQRDVEWQYAFELVRPVFFWNPIFHLWRRRIESLREMACDHRILTRRGLDLGAYCACLLRVCNDSLAPRRLWSVDMPVVGLMPGRRGFGRAGRGQALRRRLEAVIDTRVERPLPRSAALALLPIPLMIFLGGLAIQQSGDWSQDRLMFSTILNLERLATLNPGYSGF